MRGRHPWIKTESGGRSRFLPEQDKHLVTGTAAAAVSGRAAFSAKHDVDFLGDTQQCRWFHNPSCTRSRGQSHAGTSASQTLHWDPAPHVPGSVPNWDSGSTVPASVPPQTSGPVRPRVGPDRHEGPTDPRPVLKPELRLQVPGSVLQVLAIVLWN